MHFVPSISDLDSQCGDYTRDRLEQMNQVFTAAVERAFELGLESRAAAGATIRLKSSLNGSRLLAEEAAIGAAWDLLCRKKGDMTALEVVNFVRERVPNVDQARVRFGLEQRFRQRGVGW